MTDMTNPPKKSAGAAGGSYIEDDDIVQFDLGGSAMDDSSNLHVNLEEDASTEDMSMPAPNFASEPAGSMSSGSMSFSLGGDDVMDLFETLMKKIEELKAGHEESIRNHKQTILQEQEAIKKEESEYQQKLSQMLERLENLKMKLAGTSAPKTMKKA